MEQTDRSAGKALSAECVSAKSRRQTWEPERWAEEGGWAFWEAAECDECGKVIVVACPCDEEHAALAATECEGYMHAEGPMVNCFYPVGERTISRLGGPEEAAKLLADLPLCIVEVDDEFGLALTGCGMNLSWEICEAYTHLGLLPPVDFCDLPAMAGRGTMTNGGEDGAEVSERDQRIIAACKRACAIQIKWAAQAIDKLDSL